ncbi:PulJ/GspJ family protein [Thalassomonas haliotis]|uniref:Type II secretion system protein n=1 Tax=Thalassomonas haliotis TaxID=485448 RepID=A0ABY7VII7_9GAMM|nr:type II secretion system protein [Thalassomonas haliotis]WDE13266.1 type II secretion system protein [Thalassomonas haliotis]
MMQVKQPSKTRGFTLIEVLVATIILFTSIATVSMIYRGAFLSSEKADRHIKVTSVLPALLANIRNDIRAQGNSPEEELSKQGKAWYVQYSWRAKLVDHKSAPRRLDVDTGNYITPPLKYKLWLVELTMQFQTTTREYQFYELSWSND